jgi:hypothetical protein
LWLESTTSIESEEISKSVAHDDNGNCILGHIHPAICQAGESFLPPCCMRRRKIGEAFEVIAKLDAFFFPMRGIESQIGGLSSDMRLATVGITPWNHTGTISG